MKLTFIGTSHGIPERERRCSCTMIESGESVYFVDAGTDAMEEIRRRGIEPERVKAFFITHMHGDHANGILSFADLANWYFGGAQTAFCLPTQKGIDAVKTWIESLETGTRRELDYRLVKDGAFYDDGVLKATAFRTKHVATSYAFLIECEGRRVLFTGDLARPEIDFPHEIFGTRTDIAVCETAHFDPREYAPVFEKFDCGKIILNHFQPRKEPLAAQFAVEMRGKTEVVLSFDGMEAVL